MKRILQMNIENKNMGGAYVLIRRCEEEIRRLDESYIFDYMSMNEFDSDTDLYPLEGSRIFSAQLRKNRLIGHIKLPFYVYNQLKDNNYEVVHIHSELAWKMLLYAGPAKLAGVKHIVLHAHSTGIDGKFRTLKSVCQHISKGFIPMVSKNFLACSEEAADFVMGKSVFEKYHGMVLKNGIDLEKFSFSEEKRKKIRKELNIEDDTILIGNTSRIAYQKNPLYLIEVFGELKKLQPNIKLLFVGGGDEWIIRDIEKMLVEKHLNDDVIFLGHRKDIDEILCALDIFVFPSRFEGLGISLVEAQTAGLPCFISDRVPELAKVLNTTYKISIDEKPDVWAKKINEIIGTRKENAVKEMRNAGFELKDTAADLKRYYDDLY